jgi:hypothetical protein
MCTHFDTDRSYGRWRSIDTTATRNEDGWIPTPSVVAGYRYFPHTVATRYRLLYLRASVAERDCLYWRDHIRRCS